MGTSSGPAGKEVYHGTVGGPSAGYKVTPQQHNQQTRGQVSPQSVPSSHFSQEQSGPQANTPPLRINICGQV